MKVLVIICACIIALEAKPFFGLGYGYVYPPPLLLQRCFMLGRRFGGQYYDRGMSGFGQMGYYNTGASHYHNIGAHHNKVTSVNHSEDSGFHNVGGGSAVNKAGFTNNAFNNYQNGASEFGNNYNAASQGANL